MKHIFLFENFIESDSLVNEEVMTALDFNPSKELTYSSGKEMEKAEKWDPIIKLTDPKIRSKITSYVYTRSIDLTYNALRNGTYDNLVNGRPPKITPIKGVTYTIVNDNTIKYVFPAIELAPNERCVIDLNCFPLVNTATGYRGGKFQQFDKPGRGVSGDPGVWVHDSCGGQNKSGKFIPGEIWKGKTKRNVPGGVLNVIIDLTKVNGYVSWESQTEMDSLIRNL